MGSSLWPNLLNTQRPPTKSDLLVRANFQFSNSNLQESPQKFQSVFVPSYDEVTWKGKTDDLISPSEAEA